MFTKQALARLALFITARHMVHVRRAQGGSGPWTKDPILQKFRFCNIYRELDRTTMFIRDTWAPGCPEHPWFHMAVARLLNWPDSLTALGPPAKWNRDRFVRVLEDRQARGLQVFGPAYIVSTNGKSVPKIRYLADEVLTSMWNARNWVDADTLYVLHRQLMQFQGMGSFMAAQVVADVKNMAGSPIAEAVDWWTWAAPGPGSTRGMNRLLGNGPKKSGIKPDDFLSNLHKLQMHVNPVLREHGWPALCAQDMQNCLCEFDKYERVRLGEGTPKQLFKPVEPAHIQGELL